MSEDAVALDHVSRSFGPARALDDVSFVVRAGESVGYLGPNGAGKSTTLKLLVGLLAPSAGRVRLLGRAPEARTGGPLAHVGALIETPGLPGYLRGRDVLEYAARVKGLGSTARGREVQRVAEATGVRDRLDVPVGTLSTGLLRRLELALALVGDPDVLLLDEPTLGLDPAARADLRGLLAHLARSGRAMLLSSHLLEDVEEVCSRVLFLRAGRLVGDRPLGDAATGGRRALALTFLREPEGGRLAAVLRPDEIVETRAGRSVRVTLPDDDARQADLLVRLGAAGLSVVTAERRRPSLHDQYLALVGREDGP